MFKTDKDIIDFLNGNKQSIGESHYEAACQILSVIDHITKNDIKGDIIEIGVYKGGKVVAIIAKLIQLGVTDRKIHLYDTFTGMTEPCEKDVDPNGNIATNIIEEIKCYSPLEEVKRNMSLLSYPVENIVYHIGDIRNEKYEDVPRNIAFLRLDTDFYDSTKHELDIFTKNVSPNGIITSDDYNWWKGCTQAVNEYIEASTIPIKLNLMYPHGAWWVHASGNTQNHPKLHIVIIGPGIMPIPPTGWGAVESLIWDYKIFLERDPNLVVTIVNLNDKNQIIHAVNQLSPDIVHIQYDDHWDIVTKLLCKNIVATSHYGYIDSLDSRLNDGYWNIFSGFLRSSFKIHALSPSIRDMYIKHGCDPSRLSVVPNGANSHIFKFLETPLYPAKSIYLAKIDSRKRQKHYQSIKCIDFVGNITDHNFDTSNPNYLGEWSKSTLYDNLTNYSNLVLLSDGEAHPLVCCEALICGLGLVLSKYASSNLDLSLPWIDVIPDEKLNDIAYIENVILNNQKKSIQYRKDIREYGLTNFSWTIITKKYLTTLSNWFGI
jgi:hypothetical protein